jgi:hypothetical protein
MTPQAIDEIRIAAAKTEALAHAAETAFDSMVWPTGVDRQDIERLAHLVGAAAEAAAAAVHVVDRHNSELADSRPVTGERGEW